MDDWIEEVINLPEQWLNIAAGKAYRHLKDNDNNLDELLIGYELATSLLDKLSSNYANHKHTLSDQDEEDLKLAINLAKIVIPNSNPLYLKFLKNASFMTTSLDNEIKEINDKNT